MAADGTGTLIAMMGAFVLGGVALSITLLMYLRPAPVVVPLDPPMYNYQGTEGPFIGVLKDGVWSTGPRVEAFKPGDAVVWLTNNAIPAGVNVFGEFVLFCQGQPYFAEDNRITSTVPRAPGYRPYHLILPANTPDGLCEIRRHLTLTSADGSRVQERTFPTVYVPVRKS